MHLLWYPYVSFNTYMSHLIPICLFSYLHVSFDTHISLCIPIWYPCVLESHMWHDSRIRTHSWQDSRIQTHPWQDSQIWTHSWPVSFVTRLLNHICLFSIRVPSLLIPQFLLWYRNVSFYTHMSRGSRCVTWLIHMCDVIDLYVCNMKFTMSCTPPQGVWHGSFICGTWLVHMCVTWLF